jgi:putative dimethyl sulfoxide reductase chaperone
MPNETLSQFLIKRADTYAFLSHLYWREPSPELLKELTVVIKEIEESLVVNESWRSFIGFIREIDDAAIQELSHLLSVEYAGLFLNAGKTPVHPYESVYSSEDGLMMQNARDEVVEEYSRAGIVREIGLKEPEDHIALELAFMSYLCRQARDCSQQYHAVAFLRSLQRQKAFLEEHLIKWIPAFCRDLEHAAESEFYKGVARYTVQFLEVERQYLQSLNSQGICAGFTPLFHWN